MACKRNQLMNMFPPGKVTAEQASEALRKSRGDLEKAQAMIQAGKDAKDTKPSARTTSSAAKKPAAAAVSSSSKENKLPSKPAATTKEYSNNAMENDKKNTDENVVNSRRPPKTVVAINNNLSDRQYCCVWWVEEIKDGYRPDISRSLLAEVARHANLILRDRGWRVKRLIESTSTRFLGVCYSNGRNDADAASANIMLNLRQRPDKNCRQFRTFAQIMAVMIHEVTHISIGLEDIHPPAFWELMQECKKEYQQKLAAEELEQETDDYGCKDKYITGTGEVSTLQQSAGTVVSAEGMTLGEDHWCGAKRARPSYSRRGTKRSSVQAVGIKAAELQQKRRPLKKGTKMIDKRTKDGKAKAAALKRLTPRELAARAALERWQGNASGTNDKDNNKVSNQEEEDDDDDLVEVIEDHPSVCGCRCCEWDKLLCQPAN